MNIWTAHTPWTAPPDSIPVFTALTLLDNNHPPAQYDMDSTHLLDSTQLIWIAPTSLDSTPWSISGITILLECFLVIKYLLESGNFLWLWSFFPWYFSLSLLLSLEWTLSQKSIYVVIMRKDAKMADYLDLSVNVCMGRPKQQSEKNWLRFS